MPESGPIDVPCIRISEPGGPEVLTPSSTTLAAPGPGWVRVRVTASGVNRADLLQRRGRYPAAEGIDPSIPGLEYAGVVDAVGSGCSLRSRGDRVMGIVGGGGYAAAVTVPERETIRVPEGLSLLEAAAIPEAFLTAWDALEIQAGLVAGETVLIHAVGSGVGTAAVQLARTSGARTIGTSRTPTKVERARGLGLDLGVPSGEASPDWADRVLEATDARGVDVILDLVGASYLGGNQRVLGQRGRWIVVGVPGGLRGEIDLRALMTVRGRILGTVLRARAPEEKAALARAFEGRVVPRFERGLLRPVVGEVMPAPQASDAHRRLESNQSWGTVLLRWS